MSFIVTYGPLFRHLPLQIDIDLKRIQKFIE